MDSTARVGTGYRCLLCLHHVAPDQEVVIDVETRETDRNGGDWLGGFSASAHRACLDWLETRWDRSVGCTCNPDGDQHVMLDTPPEPPRAPGATRGRKGEPADR